MAGEAIRVPSAWESVITPASQGNGVFSAESTAIGATGLSANEKLYELADFELVVTGTPVQGSIVSLLRRPKGNTNAAAAPASGYDNEYLGPFVMNSVAGGSYYIYGVPVGDSLDTYYLKNEDGGTLTLGLTLRTRTSGPAA